MNYLKLKNYLIVIAVATIFMGCGMKSETSENNVIDKYSYNLGIIGGFSELVQADVKQLALSDVMTTSEMNEFISEANKIAERHGISTFRETELIVTDLFPADVAVGKEVLLLFKGTTKQEYFALKDEIVKLKEEGKYDDMASRKVSRRFGRMLSYSPRKINTLITKNTAYRTMADFGVRANHLFLYYNDLKKASQFYVKTLGFEIVADYKMAQILRMTEESYLIIVDGTGENMHTTDEPKSVALALITDKLDEWYNYLASKNVKIKYDYQPKTDNAHDGFVIYDTEGYLLEFETFKQHPENEKFIPLLNINKEKTVIGKHKNTVPDGLGFHSTITWLYHKDVLGMQKFYENVLGIEMVADQGWCKIYKVSETGFMGIVDEKRGMNKWSKDKALNIGFVIDSLDQWFDYVYKNKIFELRSDEVWRAEENKFEEFVGYGPENYYMEFDRFNEHKDNTMFMKYLMKKKL